MTIDQIEGNEPLHENWGLGDNDDEIDESGDPPRLWDYTGVLIFQPFFINLFDMLLNFMIKFFFLTIYPL